MRDQLGSHWRWRLLLLVVLVLTVAGARWQAPWCNMEIVPGGSDRIVAASRTQDRLTIKLLDINTGHCRDVMRFEANQVPTTLRVVHEGKSLAWRSGNKLHIADIDAPYRTKSWPVPTDLRWPTIEGFSSDERFAIFQTMERAPAATGKTPGTEYQYLISIVDLTSGQVVSSEKWGRPIEATRSRDEFRLTQIDTAHGNWPASAVCKLTPTGQWEHMKSTSRPTFSQYEKVRLAESPQGKIRRLLDKEVAAPAETEISGRVLAMSPSGHMVVDGVGRIREPFFIGHADASELRRTASVFRFAGASYPQDGAVAFVNLWDDVEVIDLANAKTIAIFELGTHRKRLLAALAIGAWVIAATCVWVGVREKSSWWELDAAAATVIVQLGSLIWFGAHLPTWQMIGTQAFFLAYMAFIAGMIAGVSIVVGWYWTYGRGRTAVRWIIGGFWLCAVSACLSPTVFGELAGVADLERMDILWALTQAVSIVVAGFAAILLLVMKTLGWSVSNAPIDQPAGRFGLTSLFVATIGVSMLIAVGNAVVNEFNPDMLLLALAPILAAFVTCNLLVSLAFSRPLWVVVFHVAVILLLLPAIWIAARASLGFMVWLPPASPAILGAFLASAAISIAITCGLARCHGWRWMRASRAIEPPPEMEAARESIESAPQSADVGNQPVLN